MFNIKRIVAFLVVILVVIIIQTRNKTASEPFKGILGDILNPCIMLVDSIKTGISDVWGSYIFLIDVEEQNRAYKAAIDNLTLENALLNEKLSQTERLQGLLRFNDAYNFDSITSNVIGASDGYIKNIVIDRGLLDGVMLNDPVIGFKGLIGKVSKVHSTTADVDVLLNLSSNVSVTNSRTRAVGILRGDGRGGLHVEYYDRLDDVQVGDKFVTSGLGRLFPKGIPVGAVSKVVKSDTGLFQQVFIEQNEDFYKLENVFVIKNFKK